MVVAGLSVGHALQAIRFAEHRHPLIGVPSQFVWVVLSRRSSKEPNLLPNNKEGWNWPRWLNFELLSSSQYD
jgi:hypothetical protein